jgi:hypothetical protein
VGFYQTLSASGEVPYQIVAAPIEGKTPLAWWFFFLPSVAGFPAPGNFTVTMTYSGDANFESASAGAILTVAKAVPQITLIPPAQVVAGQEAVFTVRAGAPSGLAFRPLVSGQVSLTGVANGATANLVPNPGSSIATLRQTFSAAGTFSISVQYGGDANYQSATSAPVQVVVQ